MKDVIHDPLGAKRKLHESLKRRRHWINAGWMPPGIASGFTMGENAILAVIASEVMAKGQCDLSPADIADQAGVSETMVGKAVRQASALRLITIADHRIMIVSRQWSGWIDARKRAASDEISPKPGA